ncbi:MAG: 2-C-methyl-D-erythritol 4-phosphate cytidylyltransferase, partial [Alphaproteobacteria bacterium]
MQQNTTLTSPSSSSPRRVALILAAGSGQRFGGSRNKVYARLADGRTLLRAAVDLCMTPALSEVRVVIARGDEDAYAHAIEGVEGVEKGEKVGAAIFGGGVRAESVLRGLE